VAPLSTRSEQCSEPTSDFDLLPAFQHAVPLPVVETPGGYLEPELSEAFLKDPPAFSHDTTMASFDQSPIGEDGVPASVDYNRGFDPHELEPNVIKWMATNQGIQFHGRCYLHDNR
jgi:hypothetical protein